MASIRDLAAAVFLNPACRASLIRHRKDGEILRKDG